MKEYIFKLIDKYIQDYELYETDESYWLINPETKQWVIELTKDGTLWYYYYFFEKIYRLFSLDVVDNQHYITEWVEDAIQNGVRHTGLRMVHQTFLVEDTIQNGVRHTLQHSWPRLYIVEDTIQNGVRHTKSHQRPSLKRVEDTIQNGKN